MVLKPQPPKTSKGDLDFPWEGNQFLEEDTSDYPELAGRASDPAEDTVDRGLVDEPAAEVTGQIFEDTDRAVEDTDQEAEDTSEILEEEEDKRGAASREASRSTEPTPGERFFPDIPELARDEEGSAVSGLLRTADEISRIITLNLPRPGPFLQWYGSLKPEQRRRVYKGLWMFCASSLIITLFSLAIVVIFPLMEDHFTVSFGPRPKHPVRFLPKEGAAFALVEDRPYGHDRFIAGMDCIWVTTDPVRGAAMAGFGPFLEYEGEIVALLDGRQTWNGMTRLYFKRGDIPPDQPVDLVIPVEGGGTIPLDDGPGYRLASPGGDVPARVLLGPVIFKEDIE